MNEAFKVLDEAKRQAEKRLKALEQDTGKHVENKRNVIRHAIASIDEGRTWLEWCLKQRNGLAKLQGLIGPGKD